MTQEELKILENLVQELREKEDYCLSQMTFCRKHKFEMETTALEYRREAYNCCMLKVMDAIDKLKSMKVIDLSTTHE